MFPVTAAHQKKIHELIVVKPAIFIFFGEGSQEGMQLKIKLLQHYFY